MPLQHIGAHIDTPDPKNRNIAPRHRNAVQGDKEILKPNNLLIK